MNNRIFGISFLTIILWLLGFFAWKLIMGDKKCWDNIFECLLYTSPSDIMGSLAGMFMVFYILAIITGCLIILYRSIEKCYNKSDDVEIVNDIEV